MTVTAPRRAVDGSRSKADGDLRRDIHFRDVARVHNYAFKWQRDPSTSWLVLRYLTQLLKT
jgi:hypothetical protein